MFFIFQKIYSKLKLVKTHESWKKKMEQQKYFGVIDYLIFALTLLLSSVIGIYFAYKQRKRLSSNEYLLASKSIPWFPLFVSMLASYFSAVGLMGYPGVIYATGITFSFSIIGTFINIVLSAELFTPIFRRMDLVSANQVKYKLVIIKNE